jgi:hypothetical protein
VTDLGFAMVVGLVSGDVVVVVVVELCEETLVDDVD